MCVYYRMALDGGDVLSKSEGATSERASDARCMMNMYIVVIEAISILDFMLYLPYPTSIVSMFDPTSGSPWDPEHHENIPPCTSCRKTPPCAPDASCNNSALFCFRERNMRVYVLWFWSIQYQH